MSDNLEAFLKKDAKKGSEMIRSIKYNKNSIFSHEKVKSEVENERKKLELQILVDNHNN